MKKLFKVIMMVCVLSLGLNAVLWDTVVVKASTVAKDTYGTNEAISDRYDVEIDEALDAYNQELNENRNLKSFSANAQPANVISQLVKVVLRSLVNQETKLATRAIVVKATAKQISTRITAHAIAEAVADGITSVMIDNLLSEKSSGMFAIEKYTDPIKNSRIMYDRNNKVIIILNATANTLVTIYKDTKTSGSSIDSRVKAGRWIKSDFKFKE